MSLVGELLNKFEAEIGQVTLLPSEGGRFEVVVNGKLIYSKLETGRHANPGEVVQLLEQYINTK